MVRIAAGGRLVGVVVTGGNTVVLVGLVEAGAQPGVVGIPLDTGLVIGGRVLVVGP